MHEIMLCSTKYLQFIYHKVLSMAPPKDHAVGDLLIVAKFEFIWLTSYVAF
jgi:hypothetical protein